MNIKDFTALVESNDLDKLKSTLEAGKCAYMLSYALGITDQLTEGLTEAQVLKQYNPKSHDIFDTAKRQDKVINGEGAREGAIVKVARIPLPEQKRIVLMAATFLGNPKLNSTPKEGIETDMFSVLQTIWEDNKLDFRFKNISKRTMSERECAELWFTQDAEEGYWEGTPMDSKLKLSMRIISPSLGDKLLPVFDNYGSMIAFGRYYELIEFDATSREIKVPHFDLYTPDRIYFAEKIDGNWTIGNDVDVPEKKYKGDGKLGRKNLIGKIPVIYYSQPYTEWHDVQELIDRMEVKVSNHADTNDYYDSPIVKAKGKVTGFADKGESGKVLIMDKDADAEYMTYDNLPESMKMEMDNLLKFINLHTHTPDISAESLKGILGGTPSGFAIKMLFMDAHMKASDKEEIFGQCVQRRINYLKAAIVVLNANFKAAIRLIIKPEFTYFLPKNETEEINNIVKCVEKGILSIETAVRLNPLVYDHIGEQKRIKAESDAAAAKAKQNPPTYPNPNT